MWAPHKHSVMATDRCMRVRWRADATQAVTVLHNGAWDVTAIEWATLCESLHELGELPNDCILHSAVHSREGVLAKVQPNRRLPVAVVC